MRKLLEQITANRDSWPIIWEFLTKKWPQVNSETRINHTSQIEIIIADIEPVDFSDYMIRVPKRVWKTLKNGAFYPTLQELDNPIVREEYHRWLFREFYLALKVTFWRIAGRLLKRQDWYNKSTELVPSLIALKPNMRRLEWEQVQWLSPARGYAWAQFAYDPLHDTLYVMKGY